ncbi:hypothetical protein ATEIFO6365_0004013400 [Aspergillus terreus]|uniref:Uncharacterized protein n=1 Tax=Aspergillus terreus TaxID=33178 RepID=A0A8H3MKX6_ASPTE|nr:hypothetical protein ATEIFO6365_0004013400 [Aspergillus terreus]
MIRSRAHTVEITKDEPIPNSNSPTEWCSPGSLWSRTTSSRVPIGRLAFELPSHEAPTDDQTDAALQTYDTWIQHWQALGSEQAKRDEGSSSGARVKEEKSAAVSIAKEAEWRVKHACDDVSGIAHSKTYESICSRVLRVEMPTREHLTHRDVYDYSIALARRGDTCGEADAHALWADGTSCDYGAAIPTLRRWTPRRRDIWGDAVRDNIATIHDAVDNLYYSCADARSRVSDYECLADSLMAAFVRYYSDDDASGVYVQGISLLRKGNKPVLDTWRIERAISEICSYTYYESLVRGATEISGLDQHGAACAVADIIAPGHSGSYLIIRNLTVPLAYGSLVAYVNDMTDLATDVETVDMNSAAEAAVRTHTTARAAYDFVSGLSTTENGAAVAGFKRAELHVRKLISERDDRDLLLYSLRWVGANDGEAARGWAWWCEPQVVTASNISNYLRRPCIKKVGTD